MITVTERKDDHLLAEVNLAEANMANADAFKTELIELLNREKKNIVLDMQQVKYVDSTFLGALVAALKHALALKLDVALVSLNKDIYDLMSLIRLDKVFKIYNSFAEATVN